MKNRLTLADLLAEVRDLRRVLFNMRLLNVYDAATPGETGKGSASGSTFLLKFGEPDREKVVVVIESGVRVHCTRYARDKPMLPGGFTMKLRKHVRGRRLTGLSLLGLDRVLDLTFGSGPAEHHLIVELYDRGNVVLTDANYTILSLLRNYTLGGEAAGGAGAPGGGGGGEGGEAPAAGAGASSAGVSSAPPSASASTVGTPAPGAKVRVAVRATYALPDAVSASHALLGAAHGAVNARVARAILGGGGAVAEAGARAPTGSSESGGGGEPLEGPGGAPLVDPTAASTADLCAALSAFVAHFRAARLPALAPKARRKLKLAGALATRGSGLDLLGPVLLEHAAAAAGLAGGGAAGLDALDSPAALQRFAAHVRSLPAILRAVGSRDTTAVVMVDGAGGAAGVSGGAGALMARVGGGA